VRKLIAVLIVSIAVTITHSPHSALAKGDKSTTNLFKYTATGKHYNNTTLMNPNSTGAGSGRGPNNNSNSTAVGIGRGPKPTPDNVGVKTRSR
jgi:hypothetical protein